MEISKDAVVSIDYKLTNDDGQVLDSSEGREPLSYLHGHGNLIPGLETALAGKKSGDAVQTTLAPADGYGVRDESLVQDVPRDRFDPSVELKAGMQFQAETPEGMRLIRVVDVQGDQVKVDGNHPLADVTLNFDVKVVDVREATPEELSHGHAHGPGGTQH